MPLARATEFVDLRNLPPMDVIFGRSSMMAAARGKLEHVAETTVPVLLQGESGTGKEVFAKLGQGDLSRNPLLSDRVGTVRV
jgi:transcriptional regulator with PAS, ATPase and Fis domain